MRFSFLALIAALFVTACGGSGGGMKPEDFAAELEQRMKAGGVNYQFITCKGRIMGDSGAMCNMMVRGSDQDKMVRVLSLQEVELKPSEMKMCDQSFVRKAFKGPTIGEFVVDRVYFYNQVTGQICAEVRSRTAG